MEENLTLVVTLLMIPTGDNSISHKITLNGGRSAGLMWPLMKRGSPIARPSDQTTVYGDSLSILLYGGSSPRVGAPGTS